MSFPADIDEHSNSEQKLQEKVSRIAVLQPTRFWHGLAPVLLGYLRHTENVKTYESWSCRVPTKGIETFVNLFFYQPRWIIG